MLSAYSPVIIPAPGRLARQRTRHRLLLSGYRRPTWQPSAELQAFLDAGDAARLHRVWQHGRPQPGSILARLVLEALAQSGQRGLLLTGWGGLRPELVPDNVFVLDSAPHSWLFPRMAAVVHHGGAGTTAEGLRAGVPTVIVPFVLDQPFWGARVKAMGLGPDPLPQKKLTAERLADAIRIAVTDSEMKQRAHSCGEAIRAENGIGNAVKIIQRTISANPQAVAKEQDIHENNTG